MAPSSPIGAHSHPSSMAPETMENNIQPFYVLHKASSRGKDRKSTGYGRKRRRKEAPSSLQSPKKLDRSIAEEHDGHHLQQLQFEAFCFIWSKIESTIKDVLRDINAGVFDEIRQWVLACFDATRATGEPSFANSTGSFPVLNTSTPSQLFTGLVITKNVEFVDDILTFEELSLFLKSQGCHVGKLSSLDFSVKNGIAGCLKALLREFMDTTIDSADISNLASWYREQGNYNKPLVLIINDLERCSRSVLTDFIPMLCEWVNRVPIILIFGVTTTVDSLRSILPSHVLHHLCPCKFMLGSPAERMDSIIETVLVKHCTIFSIGYKVALFLRNNFLNRDGTLTSFIRALKISCMLHFSVEPLSLILSQILAEEDQDGKFALSPDTVLKFVHELPPCARNRMADETGRNLAQGLANLVIAMKLWSTAVLCLHEAGKYNRIRLLDLFCEALNSDLFPSRASDCQVSNKNDCGLSSSSSYQQCAIIQKDGFISQIVRKVRDLPPAMLFQLIKSWEKCTEGVVEIHDKLKTLQSSLRCEDGQWPTKISDVSKKHATRISLNSEDSRVLNSQVVTFMNDLIRSYIRPISCMPFHEIFCFNEAEKLQMALTGDPRSRIQVDLLDFNKILRCSCCKKSSSALLPSMHDSSIMYSLAEEHGDLINLHDWFKSFKTIILDQKNKRKQKLKQSPHKRKRKDTNESSDPSEASIQARFCNAVTELQIIGVLRMPSKRRPDCVQRVAFGL
ncbi:origin of replication complex subunit 3-like [Prosopis cineraria]|uniref:origin of replication complex subunit 3-like n=1 Tax=Prosopis cineraria TaxID=364024 RepID=UPI00240EDA3D|nr:origin of replication complex subunit 3-like [Prosopis cineraria]